MYHSTDLIFYQETSLDILYDDECADLGSDLEVNPTMELCAGSKKEFPKIEKFKLTRKGFVRYGYNVNYLGVEKRKYNFYLGGTDSCQGRNHKIKKHEIHKLNIS